MMSLPPPLPVSEVVPMLSTVLSRMIPMLGATKQDNMQWVFAFGECTYNHLVMFEGF